MAIDLRPLVRRLDPLIRRLSSNHEGERVAVVGALERVLGTVNGNFHDLADHVAGAPVTTTHQYRPHPGADDWAERIETLLGCGWISAWEREFLTSVGEQLRWRRQPSDKQRAVIERLWTKYTARGM